MSVPGHNGTKNRERQLDINKSQSHVLAFHGKEESRLQTGSVQQWQSDPGRGSKRQRSVDTHTYCMRSMAYATLATPSGELRISLWVRGLTMLFAEL